MHKKITPTKAAFALWLLTIFSLLGCGGSSAGSSSMNLFITDDANAGYTGVWVKVFKVTLKGSAGASAEVFNSTDGVTVNLRALNDGAAKFLLLAPASVPNGTYTKVEFELDKSVTLVATGSGAVSTVNFPDSLDATVSGHSVLSADLSPPIVVPGTSSLVIDFDLSNWNVSGGVLTPILHRHNGNGLNDVNRHHEFEFNGTVSDLAGPASIQTFTLSLRHGGSVKVTTNDTTVLTGDTEINALSNGLHVEVYGVYDPATNSILAKIIRVESSFHGEAKAVGAASDGLLAAGTFTIAPAFTRGFTPQGDTVNITTTANTHYRGKHGAILTKSQFFVSLALAGGNAVAEAEGTYDLTSNTLTAKSVSIENNANFGEDEAKGTASLASLVDGTFDLAVTESEGFDPPSGALHIKVTTDAQYKDAMGETMTAADFFAAISSSSLTVKVKGSFADDVFTASRIEIKN